MNPTGAHEVVDCRLSVWIFQPTLANIAEIHKIERPKIVVSLNRLLVRAAEIWNLLIKYIIEHCLAAIAGIASALPCSERESASEYSSATANVSDTGWPAASSR